MMYLLIAEAIIIIALLSWEVFWLRRMFYTLKDTSDKLERVVDGIKSVVKQLEQTSSPLASIIKMFALNGERK